MNRMQMKHAAMLIRGGAGYAKCDLCHERMATDYHELIPRSMTRGNKLAEETSYRPTLCACLCNSCHIGLDVNAHSPVMRDRLLKFNYNLYGRDAVQHDFDEVNQCLKVKLPFKLP